MVCMFRRRATPPPPAGWDPVVTVVNGVFTLAPDTVEVHVRGDGAVTVWRGVDDYCYTDDPATACQLIDAAEAQQVHIRAYGRPPAMDTRGIIRG